MVDRGLGRLACERLAVRRGGELVVSDVSTAFEAGCWTAILGANGCGKTTLLRALAGRLPIASGRIFLDGRDATDNRETRAQRIGFCVDVELLPEAISPQELFAAVAWERQSSVDPVDVTPVLHALAIDEHLHQPIGILSSGLRQRVALYCAFIGSPSIAVLDEPFNWLDPVVAYDLKSALSQVTKQGLSLITALHDTTSALTQCDRLLLMRRGCLVFDRTREQLITLAGAGRGIEQEIVAHLREAAVR